MKNKNKKTNKKSQYIIHVDLDKGDPIYDAYNYYVLSNSFSEYIDRQIAKASLNDEITINIYAKEIDDKTKSHLKSIMINHYKDTLREIETKETNSNLSHLIIFLLGIICIILYHGLSTFLSSIILDILNITGWFAIWEVVDTIAFPDASLRLKHKRAIQLTKAHIIIK